MAIFPLSSPRLARRALRTSIVALVLSSAVAALAPSVAYADVAITPEARAHFTAGVNLLKDPDGPRYEEAYREFRVAYASSPSFKILGNLGLCAMKLERDQEAITAYEKYLEEGKDQLDASAVQQVQTDLQTLKAGVAWITVSSTPPGAQVIDVRLPVRGERITNAYGPITQSTKIGVHQGTHQVTARLAGYPDVVWEFDTSGTREIPEHVFEFKAAAVAQPIGPVEDNRPRTVMTSERPVPTGVWIGAAATGALAVGTIVVGVLATSKHSDYQTANDGRDPGKATSLKDSGQTLNLVTDVMLAGTVVAAGVTSYLFFTRPTVEVASSRVFSPAPSSATRTESRVPTRVVPSVGAHGGGLVLTGGLPWM